MTVFRLIFILDHRLSSTFQIPGLFQATASQSACEGVTLELCALNWPLLDLMLP